jgi:preprotein translocase subunit SecG
MSILYGLLTCLLFLDCVILVLLVLLQLPKKEAGAGMAFGGGATDALFGAGSGNVLTKITKYAAGIFFGLAIIMAMVASHRSKTGAEALTEELSKQPVVPFKAPAASPATAPSDNSGLLQTPLISNLPPAQSSAPAAPAASPAGTATPPGTNK